MQTLLNCQMSNGKQNGLVGLFHFPGLRFHNDNSLDVNDDRFQWENTATPSLSISHVQPGDAGEYSCSAENKIGQSRSPLTFNLDVTCKEQMLPIFI